MIRTLEEELMVNNSWVVKWNVGLGDEVWAFAEHGMAWRSCYMIELL